MAFASGQLVVISGPAGSGKTCVVRRLVQRADLDVKLSVSATTRPPRAGEKEGVDYCFKTRAEFEADIQRGAFLEWAEVFGNLYGTPKQAVEEDLAAGHNVLLEIDVQGARQVRDWNPEARLVFLEAPHLQTYEQRLRARATDREDVIQRRLAEIQRELACAEWYHHRVVNRDLDAAVEEIAAIIRDRGGLQGCVTN